MKKYFLLICSLLCCSGLIGLDLNLKKIRIFNCKNAQWKAPLFRSGEAQFNAAIDVNVPKQPAGTEFNRVRLEITPICGKFIKRNFLIILMYDGKKLQARPLQAPFGMELKANEKNILEYHLPIRVRNLDKIRICFNRKQGVVSRHDFKLHKVELGFVYRPRSAAEFKYKLQTPNCTLTADDDLGMTPREALYVDFGKRSRPLRDRVAVLPFDEKISGNGTATRKTVKISFLEEAGVSRQAQLRFGVPFAEKELFSLDRLQLLDEKNKPVPAQFSALVRYPDRSVRHLFVTALGDFKKNESKEYTLVYGNQIRTSAPAGALRYTRNGDVLDVDAGRIKARIRKNGFALAENLTVDGNPAGKFLPAAITMADGRRFTLGTPKRFEIIESGPLRMTLRAAGNYTGNAGSYVVRLTFVYNSPKLELDFTHINTVLDSEFTDFKSLYLNFAPADKVKKEFSLLQENDLELSRNGGKRQKGRHPGAFRIGKKTGVAIADFWQRYPKSVSVSKNVVSIGLLPEQPAKDFNSHLDWKLKYLFSNGNYRMKWGMCFTERITFDFSGASEKELAAERNMPVIGVLPFAWYRQLGLVPDDGNLAPVDAGITDAFNRYIARQKREREFGFFNYGDSFGERGNSWTNNEYDPAQSIAATFLRTGNRSMLRYALATARHQADVDTCHAYPNEYFIGANVQHAVGHTGFNTSWSGPYHRYSAASGGHSWARGRLLVWLLCADTVVMESAMMFGDHTAFAVIPNYKSIIGLAPREIGWMLREMVPLYEVTRDPDYLAAMKTAAALAVKECAYENGAWPRRIHRIFKGYKVSDKGNVTYQAALMLKGLCDYYRLTGDQQVKRAISTTSRWIIKAFHPAESAGFHYDLSADGRVLNWPFNGINSLLAPPLAEAAVICNDPAVMAVAQQAMAKILLCEHPISHKHFALELTFVADYLAAAARWNKQHQLQSDYSYGALYKKFFENTVQSFRLRGDSTWDIVALEDQAPVTLCRWIRSGMPKNPVRAVLRDASGKIVLEKQLPPHILQQRVTWKLPGKKGSRFVLEIRDSFRADWSFDPASRCLYAGRMRPEGLAVSHIGLRRFFIRVPAGAAPVIRYAGSHTGEWSIQVNDSGKVYRQGKYSTSESVQKMRKEAAEIRLPRAKQERLVEMICFATLDGRILVKGIPVIFTNKDWK